MTKESQHDHYSDAFKDEYGFRPRLPVTDADVEEYFAGRGARMELQTRELETEWLAVANPLLGFFKLQERTADFTRYVCEFGVNAFVWVRIHPTYVKGGFGEHFYDDGFLEATTDFYRAVAGQPQTRAALWSLLTQVNSSAGSKIEELFK